MGNLFSASKVARHLGYAAALLTAVWLAYGPSVNYGFAWDDYALIVESAPNRTAPWHHVFLRHFWEIGQNEEDPTRSFYRPLVSLSYQLDQALWGLNASGFHLTNVILHGATTLAVYAFFVLLIQAPLPAFLAALLWTVHPTHVENVYWISGRTDVICGLWYFLALSLWIAAIGKSRHLNRMLFGSLAAGAYFAALMSKEAAVTFPLIAALLVLVPMQPARRNGAWYAGLGVLLASVTGMYVGLRITVLGAAVAQPAFGTWSMRLISLPMVFSRYLGLSMLLLPINPHHAEPFLYSIRQPRFLMGMLVSSLFFLTAWRFWREQWRLELVGWLWFLLTLLPVFYLGGFGDVLYADRFLYLPTAGLALTAVCLGRRVLHYAPAKRRRACQMLAGVLPALFISVSILYCRTAGRIWQDGLTLFRRVAITSPDSAYVHFNLGNSLARIGAYHEACIAYRRAIRLQPEYGRALTNYGAALNKLGRHEQAADVLRQAHAAGEQDHRLLVNLADALLAMDKSTHAILLYRQALHLRPSPWIMGRLGRAWLHKGHVHKAGTWFQAAVEQQPRDAAALNNLGLYHLHLGDAETASAQFLAAQNALRAPAPAGLRIEILFHLAQALDQTGQHAEAMEQALQAFTLQQISSVRPFPNGELEKWIHARRGTRTPIK